MKNNKEILSSILKTTQMGQVGIRTVEPYAVSPGLKTALQSQLKEYDAIEQQAMELAADRGWVLPQLHPGIKAMSRMATRMQLNGRETDSKIAGMMIKGNTQGVIKGLKNAHRCSHPDGRIAELSQKLLDTENANIHQMEPFL